MTFLDIFSLIVLLVLLCAVVAVWVMLALMPGRIARERNHPQAEAINVCGWWGAITFGLLLPVAWIWAYTRPSSMRDAEPTGTAPDASDNDAAINGDRS